MTLAEEIRGSTITALRKAMSHLVSSRDRMADQGRDRDSQRAAQRLTLYEAELKRRNAKVWW